jgi:parallel beta-helix repeat protein
LKIKSCIFSKTLVFGIILIFVGISIVPVVNSTISKEENLFNNQLEQKSLQMQPDIIYPDNINSHTLWIPEPQNKIITQNKITSTINSKDSNYKMKTSIPISIGKTLYVGGNGPGNYSRIQAAIDDANDGDTVFVYSGKYYMIKKGITIDKSINLIGENKETTIIDYGNQKIKVFDNIPVIDILRDGVTISGFTIQKCHGFGETNSGIKIRSSHNTISGNIITNNNCGIHLVYFPPYYIVDFNIITNNIIKENKVYGVIASGVQNNIISENIFNNDNLVLSYSKNNIIKDNVFYNDGAWITGSYQNTFTDNLVNDKPLVYLEDESHMVINENPGQVILINCLNITVKNKDLSNTTFGIILDGTFDCHISENNIESVKQGGIYLQYSNENNISMNTISNTKNGIVITNSYDNIIFSNTVNLNKGLGIYFANSDFNTISKNSISDNQAGLILTGGADYNNIYDNNFINDGGVWIYGAWKNTLLNNTLNDKPIIYLEEKEDMLIDEDAVQVILVNCNNIEVKDQDVSDTYAGIMIVASENCKVSNSSFNNHKRCGIFLTHSNNNNVSKNIITNSETGITLEESKNNTLFRNTVSANIDNGIYIFYESNGNTILSNHIEQNGDNDHESGSIFLDRSSNNKIHNNNFLNNKKGYYFILCYSNKWNGNYWGRQRIFPKLIIGKGEPLFIFLPPWFNIDWHPANEPYKIVI